MNHVSIAVIREIEGTQVHIDFEVPPDGFTRRRLVEKVETDKKSKFQYRKK